MASLASSAFRWAASGTLAPVPATVSVGPITNWRSWGRVGAKAAQCLDCKHPRRHSQTWVQRHVSDPYVKQSALLGYRSRAAFKLAEIDDKHHIFNRKQRGSHGMRVVDLGSAPGGWLQVAVRKLGLTSTDTARRLAAVAAQQRSEAKAQRLRPMLRRTGSRSRSAPQSGPTSFFGLHASEVLGSEEADVDAGARAGVGLGIGDAGDAGLESSAPAANTVDALTAARACVIGVDLLPVEDVPGALFVRGDLRHNDVQARIRQLLLGHRADVVMSDMAHSFTGHAATDQIRQLGLANDALRFATQVLAPGGMLLVKTRQGVGDDEFKERVAAHFRRLLMVKPPASRKDSAEVFLLARGFRGGRQH